MTDPIQQIEQRYTKKYQREGIEFVYATGTSNTEQTYKDIQNLLKLTSIYEKELLAHVPQTYIDDIKKEVFKSIVRGWE